jgi:hypothetical protein
MQRQTLNDTNKLNVAQFSMQKQVCMLITYDAEQKKKVNFNLSFLPPTYCECDKYDSNTNGHKIISVTLWLELRSPSTLSEK